MSTAASPQTPSLSTSICSILSMLFGRANNGALLVSGRTPGGADRGRSMFLRASQLGEDWIPVPLLSALEDDCWALHVGAGVRRDVGSNDVVRLHALPVVYAIGRTMRNPVHPESPHGKKWILDEEQLEGAWERIRAFALEPSAVVFGGAPIAGDGYQLVALYRLAWPLLTDGEDEALELLRDLARALAAEEPEEGASLRDIAIPVPGSRIRETGGPDYSRVELLEPERVYTLETIRKEIA